VLGRHALTVALGAGDEGIGAAGGGSEHRDGSRVGGGEEVKRELRVKLRVENK